MPNIKAKVRLVHTGGGVTVPQSSILHPMLFLDEFCGPFPSWLTVNTTADGVFDCTSALQAAINSVGNESSTSSVVYIPSGIYKITGTLNFIGRHNIRFVASHPGSVTIKWAGAAGADMMLIDGCTYNKFERITFDGSNSARACVNQNWDGSGNLNRNFDSGNRYMDCVFKNCQFGIAGGFSGVGFAESPIVRCKFLGCTTAGIALGNFNALDIWIWYCLFDGCNIGATNTIQYQVQDVGAGNFRVYSSVFKNSVFADIHILNTGEFSFRNNYSSNSNQFLKADYTGNPCTLEFQGNTIVDTIQPTSIHIQDQGPAIFFDNTIRSRATVANPTNEVIVVSSNPDASSIYVNNTFTVASSVSGRTTPTLDSLFVDVDNHIVSRASLMSLAEPTLPATPVSQNRTVFDVPAESDQSVIQSAINLAVAAGNKAIVHIPHALYGLTSTINIPAGANIQIIGDGYGDTRPTFLIWLGNDTSPAIKVNGPSQVTFRDFTIKGNDVANRGIWLSGIDQAGSQVFGHQFEIRACGEMNLYAKQLDNTRIQFYSSGFAQTEATGIKVEGKGPRSNSRVVLYGGATSDNSISYDISGGGNVNLADVWYESNNGNQYYLKITGNSTFTVQSSHIANTSTLSQAQAQLENMTGVVAFIGPRQTHGISATGVSTGGNLMIAGGVFDNSTFLSSDATGLTINSIQNRIAVQGSVSVPDVVNAPLTASYFNTVLAEMRAADVGLTDTVPAGASKIVLDGVWIYGCARGMEIS